MGDTPLAPITREFEGFCFGQRGAMQELSWIFRCYIEELHSKSGLVTKASSVELAGVVVYHSLRKRDLGQSARRPYLVRFH